MRDFENERDCFFGIVFSLVVCFFLCVFEKIFEKKNKLFFGALKIFLMH